jgi:hypothetical protein
MIYRSINMIFEPSGLPVPTEEEVVFEAHEILQRSGWGVPLIERLRRIADHYWREGKQVFVTYNIQTHNGPIITDNHVNIHQPE